MSGGSHDYAYKKLKDIADSFYLEPEKDSHIASRKKVAQILNYMVDILHDIEWIDSADYGAESWGMIEQQLDKINIRE